MTTSRPCLLALALLISPLINACDRQSTPKTPPSRQSIPLVSAFPRDGIINRLKVYRSGNLTWNSTPVTDAQLKNLFGQIVDLPEGHRVFAEFEPGLPASRADQVPKAMIDSGLCERKHCFEIKWNTPGLIVN